MKICMISDLYWPEIIGGAETYVHIISEALAITNEVTVICISNQRKGIDYVNGVKVIRIKPSNFYALFDCASKPIYLKTLWHIRSLTNRHIYQHVKKILKKEKPEIVHTHNLQTSPLIFKAIHELTIPHIHTLHDYSLLCPRTSLLHESGQICENPKLPCLFYKNFKKRLLNANIVVAPSQFILNKHFEHGFFKKMKTQKLPYGVNLPDKEIKKNNDSIDILYVGQLSKHKGLQILIKAFKQVQRVDLHLNICGRGKDEEEFKNLAYRDNRIKFHGFLSKEKLYYLYSRANVLIVPSLWYEPSGLVMYEAFVHGTPVIGSRIGGISELIHDGENGFLFESRNEKELVEILNVLSSSILNEFSYKILREREMYGIKVHIQKLRVLYKNILDNSIRKNGWKSIYNQIHPII